MSKMQQRLPRCLRTLITSTTNTSTINTERILNPIPATYIRGGTSKGVFLQEKHLPSDRSQWDAILLGIMGSPDSEHGRQLNGMGGGISSLSKVCVIGTPTLEQKMRGIDIRYTFAQIGIRDSRIDYSGNCGNLSSMVGVYSIDEGLCKPPSGGGLTTVRAFNTNTQKVIDTTFPVSESGAPLLDLPEATVAGVAGCASKIILDFVDPGGARTGKLLPTGNPVDSLKVSVDNGTKTLSFTASLVDATNPTVFLNYDEFERYDFQLKDYIDGSQLSAAKVGDVLERLRQAGAKKMGLEPTAQAQPKIAFVQAPSSTSDMSNNVHIVVHALSMGVLHKAVPMTVGLCLGVASKIEGTIPWTVIRRTVTGTGTDSEFVRLQHPSGVVDVGARLDERGNVTSANVIRTGRKLMKGVVWW